MKYQALLFDLDGTLVDSVKLIYEAFNHVAEKYLGRRYLPEEIVRFFGPSEEATWRSLLPQERLEEGLKEYYGYYLDHHDEVILYAGIGELLQHLKVRKTPLAIVTGRGKRTTEMTLDALSLKSFFPCVITSDEVQLPKPHPQGVLLACESLGVSPEKVLMIGDSPIDIEAGRQAGTQTAGVFWGTFGLGGSLEDSHPDYAFQTPAELAAFLLNHS